jgi:hypothetical protein
MEEAHTFIKRYKDDNEEQNAAAICCQVFEKIASVLIDRFMLKITHFNEGGYYGQRSSTR